MHRRFASRLSRFRWRKFAFFSAVGLFVVAFFTSLSLPVIAQHFTGHSAAAGSDAAQNASLAHAGPVLDLSQRGAQSSSIPPAHTVALTFDDGPDPRWTPEILSVLKRRHVPATFFVIGSRVLEHPELARQELHDGHEIGLHTFSHPQMGGLTPWQQELQLSLADKAVAGATGMHTRLYRPPYSGRPIDLSGNEYDSARLASRGGRYVVLANYISFDWLPGSVLKLATNALPPSQHSGVIMFHDGGGDRHHTVAALDRLIGLLQQQGYRFTTVSQYAGLARNDVLVRASVAERAQGLTLMATAWLGHWVTTLFGALTALLLIVCVTRGLGVVAFARRHRRRQRLATVDPAFTPPVSIIVPAYNEAAGIAAAVRSLAASDYPEFEVIVVDDGSTDATSDIVSRLALPSVTLIRQENAGKAAALNTGLAHARHDVLVLVDADTVLEPQALRALVQPFRDSSVGAVSGNTKVANRKGLIGRWQHIEYVISCSVERRMFDILQCMPCVPGAIGAYRRVVLDFVGRVSRDTLAEDTDLTMAIQRAGWQVRYQPDARGWTEVPASMHDLWRQRYRWSYGTLQAMWKHRRAVREYGTGGHLGRRAMPYLIFYTIVIPVLSPLVDLFALYGLVVGNSARLIEMWLAVNLVTMAVGAYAFHLDGESPVLLLTLPLQQFVYRQFMYGVVLHAIKSALLGSRVRWQRITRIGDFHGTPVDLGGAASAIAGTIPLAGVTMGRAVPRAATAGTPAPPVFVDDTRRRTRRAIRVGLVAAGLAAAAAFALFASLAFRVSHETSVSQLPTATEQVSPAPSDIPAGVVQSAATLHAKSRTHRSRQAALGAPSPEIGDAPTQSGPTTRLAASRRIVSAPTAPVVVRPPTTVRKRSPTPTTRPARNADHSG
jgi:cellulose synthase/poly-beta-1,6-N-acetylglucosamine synthase-like glycosyltransferase/peptidoglycan/xylan/chitin deacetylase (PgdA/CDA1 family)